MFCGKGLVSLKMGSRQRELSPPAATSSATKEGSFSPFKIHPFRSGVWVVGCKEKVSYLCGRIMSVKTCSSMHASIGCELLPPSRRLYGTSSARLTTEEVVLLPKKNTKT